MISKNLQTLKIHKLSGEQYKRELESGNADVTALYLTPADEDKYIIPVSYYGVENYQIGDSYTFNFDSITDLYLSGRNVVCRVYEYYDVNDSTCSVYSDYQLVSYNRASGFLAFSCLTDDNKRLSIDSNGVLSFNTLSYISKVNGGEVDGTITLNRVQLRQGENFGTEEQLNAIENPVDGQLFFVID